MYTKKKNKEILGFDDTFFLLLGIPIVAFVVPLLFFKASLNDGLVAYLPKFGTSLMFTVAYWLGVRAVFIEMRRRFPEYQQTQKRILYTVGGIIVAYFVVELTIGYFHHNLLGGKHEEGMTEAGYAVPSIIIIALASSIYESIFFYDRWKRSLLETEQLKRENIQSQFEGLKSQVNPHFLFNSLNTLTYIIPENSEKAVTFVRKMSKVYRYFLEIRDKELITLSEELEFLQAYIFLVKERFGENLKIDLRIPADVKERQIIPLALQILIENAIKHNVVSTQDPLFLELFLDGQDRLCVRNNLQKKNQEIPSTQIGLRNIKNRYAFFTKEEVVVEESDAFFTVCLPLISVRQKEKTLDV
ncbi:MAG: hypothetical protein DHS20C18_01640 [Saprospiraceae bacterium]|nr:MAG: hypothetical protein DHS20C18_01640 [Saprospiraceae bacterium]